MADIKKKLEEHAKGRNISLREDPVKRAVGTVLLVFFVFIFGFVIGKNYNPNITSNSSSNNVDFSLFWNVWNTLEDEYVDEDAVDSETMLYGSIKGMVSSLEDPATVFLDPEETEEFELSSKGKYFEGIGAELGYENGVVIIVAPIAGTPADKAGLRPGDVILRVGDHEVVSSDTVYDLVALIRGEAGTTVEMEILHTGDIESTIVNITREEITVPSMSWELVGEDEDIALINLDRFTDSSYSEWVSNWDNIVEDIVDSGVDKIILDLRSNPGGYFDAAVYAANDFLKDGKIISQQKDKDGVVDVFKADGSGRLLDKEVVVLVDSGSASASEILAGALQQNDRAQLVGEETYGKGTAQSVIDFSDGSSLHITILKWLLPDGTSLTNDSPIVPDIEVEYTNEDFVNGDDPRMEKALEILSD
jgi:carboxyl-terminal processing protease